MHSRRRFLTLAAATTGTAMATTVFPASIQRALAIPASSRTGTIKDVEHIVVFMQENRSFDHYFGQLRGVRGHGDRFAIELASGQSVWHQPRQNDSRSVVTPFRLDTTTTSAQCVGDLDHSWKKTQAAINAGRYDQWPANKTDMTMGYHTREDLPFHYALADAFTICDNYFCSIPSQTHPNRTYLMTGMIDPTGSGGGPLIDNNDAVDNLLLAPLTWTTFPERLEAAGISWQVYQQGLDFRDDYNGNFGTNVLANFKQFIQAPRGSALQRRGMSIRTLADLTQDVRGEKLPQVSWILPPAAFSEHPRWTPGYGADYTSMVLDALTSNPEVWSKTVLLLMYDENDGFFDHVVPPQPPTSKANGISTVSVEGEIHNYVDPAHHPLYEKDGLPYGLGPRVPMTVISPWSKGGYVCSQVFDHTSIIRLIETRFGVREPNITQWRRQICGDLTSAFDFTQADAAVPALPNTSGYRALADSQCKTLAKPAVPTTASPELPKQEPGVRPARPLPYRFFVDARTGGGHVTIDMQNPGKQGVSLYVYQRASTSAPRRYSIGAGQTLTDALPVESNARYDMRVYGPNGFQRRFTGRAGDAHELLEVRLRDDGRGGAEIAVDNHSELTLRIVFRDNAYGTAAETHMLAARSQKTVSRSLEKSSHWYDVSVSIQGDSMFEQRFAGHAETGKPSTSDPSIVS